MSLLPVEHIDTSHQRIVCNESCIFVERDSDTVMVNFRCGGNFSMLALEASKKCHSFQSLGLKGCNGMTSEEVRIPDT